MIRYPSNTALVGRGHKPLQIGFRATDHKSPHVKLQAVPDVSPYPAIPAVEDSAKEWNDVPQYDVDQNQVCRVQASGALVARDR